jgi:hypothetical protein
MSLVLFIADKGEEELEEDAESELLLCPFKEGLLETPLFVNTVGGVFIGEEFLAMLVEELSKFEVEA